MKLFKLLFAVSLLALNINAASTAIISNQVATNAVIVNGGALLDNVVLYSTNTTPTIVYFYDGAITNVTAAWTNYTAYSTNQTYSYITSGGTTNLQTNTTWYVIANPRAAATNNTTPMLTLVVPGSGTGQTLNFTPPIPQIFAQRITVSNNLAGLSGVITYRVR